MQLHKIPLQQPKNNMRKQHEKTKVRERESKRLNKIGSKTLLIEAAQSTSGSSELFVRSNGDVNAFTHPVVVFASSLGSIWTA